MLSFSKIPPSHSEQRGLFNSDEANCDTLKITLMAYLFDYFELFHIAVRLIKIALPVFWGL